MRLFYAFSAASTFIVERWNLRKNSLKGFDDDRSACAMIVVLAIP